MSRLPTPLLSLAPLALAALLGGCQLTGGEAAEVVAARKEAEGKAIGGACRHAGRAIEDCFALNKRAEKAALFGGWREMNDYMRENKIEPVAPQAAAAVDTAAEKVANSGAEKAAKAEEPAAGASAPAKKPAKSKKLDG